MELVKRGRFTIKSASRELKTSCRQGKRIYGACMREGDQALIHGNAGRKSNRRISGNTGKSIVSMPKYAGFGPAFAVEKVNEDAGIKVVTGAKRTSMAEGMPERAGSYREGLRNHFNLTGTAGLKGAVHSAASSR